MARDPLLAKIHIAKKQLGLDDDTYRDVLERVTGKRSSKGLSVRQHTLLLSEFKRMGWKPTGQTFSPSTKGHVRKIYAIWADLKRKGIWREKDRASLRRFVKKMTDIDDPEFLTYGQASMVIEAMKKMDSRA